METPWRRNAGLPAGLALLLCWLVPPACVLLAGCDANTPPDHGANQSLVEIGEISLERAESLENRGRVSEANSAYRKAAWAFRYHEKLTSEQPFLMEEALEGVKRTSGKN